jgi:hypothetical protein
VLSSLGHPTRRRRKGVRGMRIVRAGEGGTHRGGSAYSLRTASKYSGGADDGMGGAYTSKPRGGCARCAGVGGVAPHTQFSQLRSSVPASCSSRSNCSLLPKLHQCSGTTTNTSLSCAHAPPAHASLQSSEKAGSCPS